MEQGQRQRHPCELKSIPIPVARLTTLPLQDAHYPGQMGGDAIMHTLLNYQGAAPAGRLTTTAYRQDFTSRPMSDMSLRNITCACTFGALVKMLQC